MYTDFITKNAGAVGQVEGALRSLTYIIPGMFLRTFARHFSEY
jgi:peroxin-16